MANEQPQAALITGWDEETEKASLAVFAEGCGYFWVKSGALEGTTVGTFQQPATRGQERGQEHGAPAAPQKVHKG